MVVQSWEVLQFLRRIRPCMIENVFRGCNVDRGPALIERSRGDNFPVPRTLRIRVNDNALDLASGNTADDSVINGSGGPEMAPRIGLVLSTIIPDVFRNDALSINKIPANS